MISNCLQDFMQHLDYWLFSAARNLVYCSFQKLGLYSSKWLTVNVKQVIWSKTVAEIFSRIQHPSVLIKNFGIGIYVYKTKKNWCSRATNYKSSIYFFRCSLFIIEKGIDKFESFNFVQIFFFITISSVFFFLGTTWTTKHITYSIYVLYVHCTVYLVKPFVRVKNGLHSQGQCII